MVWEFNNERKTSLLQEGFATYYALLAERDIYGDDYFILNYTSRHNR
jgi:hypothetical protein